MMQTMTETLPNQTTIALTLSALQSWEHWGAIRQVAEKEYQMPGEVFDRLLPEYQRFMGLIALGYHGLGMFSASVDTIWHAHILHTSLYEHFCMQIHGRMIHHIPNLQRTRAAECTSPDDICTDKCKGSCKTPAPDCEECTPADPFQGGSKAERFRAAYFAVYKQLPGDMWNLPEVDGVAAVV
jgi:hypothetical protein